MPEKKKELFLPRDERKTFLPFFFLLSPPIDVSFRKIREREKSKDLAMMDGEGERRKKGQKNGAH